MDDALREWRLLLLRCANGESSGQEFEEVIEVKEVLGAGNVLYQPHNAVVVSGQDDRVWLVPETNAEGGLVSRHDVRPGMKIKLRLRSITTYATSAFVIED